MTTGLDAETFWRPLHLILGSTFLTSRAVARHWRLVEAQDDYRRSFARALDGAPGGPFDLIVTPGCALPALRHGEGANLGFIGVSSALFNLLGYPAGVVPVSRARTDEERTRPRARDATLETAAGEGADFPRTPRLPA